MLETTQHDARRKNYKDDKRQEFFGSTRDHRRLSNKARAQNVGALHARKLVDEESAKDRRPPLSNESGERKCYKCSQYSHTARDCPQPK